VLLHPRRHIVSDSSERELPVELPPGARIFTPPPPLTATVQELSKFTVTRAVCDRIRFTRWQHDHDRLIDHGDRHISNQP
jgi:hypothetical protein